VDVGNGRGRSRSEVPGYTPLRGIAADRAGALILARDESTGARVVIRVLSPVLVGDALFMRELRGDVEALRTLRHPNLVSVFAFDERGGAVVGEWVDGPSLRSIVRSVGALDAEAAFVVFDDTLAGLEALHSVSVLHRDLHPEVVIADGDGIARIRDPGVSAPPLHAGWRSGTPQQMAPELWAGAPHSVATDLYAATAVFFEALTGRPPYPSTDLTTLRHQHEHAPVPETDVPSAQPLLLEGLAKDADERPPTATQLRADVGQAAHAAFGMGWEWRGRQWLMEHVRSRIEEPAPAAPAFSAFARDQVPDGEDAAADVERSRAWDRLRVVAAITGAVIVVIVVLAITVTALTRPADQGSFTPDALPQSTATPTVNATSTPTASSGASATPSEAASAQPSQATPFPTPPPAPIVAPATTPSPSPSPSPTSTSTPTFCIPICSTPRPG